MRANEFCYWLQGYFEICEAQGSSAAVLDVRALECVRRHLNLVKEADPNHANVFVAWLSEWIKGVQVTDTEDIRRFLAAQFHHVIDPSYGGDQKKLNQIHAPIDGTGSWSEPVYRC